MAFLLQTGGKATSKIKSSIILLFLTLKKIIFLKFNVFTVFLLSYFKKRAITGSLKMCMVFALKFFDIFYI